MKQIAQLLSAVIGLDAAAAPSVVRKAVRSRLRALGVDGEEKYFQLLLASSEELSALVEQAVVSETWFFRDRKPFESLARLVLTEWLPQHPDGVASLLSLPCATGEEPYSMVMALLDAGVPLARFRVDAMDVSTTALETARRAVYGKNSFRGKDLRFRDRYFQASPDGHSLNAAVRNKVRFVQGNILDDKSLSSLGVYDYVFCRHLLIYLDRFAQQRVFRKLHRLLQRSGVCFFGAAEVPVLNSNGFVPANLPMSFACCKEEAALSTPHGAKQFLPDARRCVSPQLPADTEMRQEYALARVVTGLSPDLEIARRLADTGRLREAAEICETHMRTHGASAQAFYLLGLARHEAGIGWQAAEFYRKALYLEPNHYETLRRLASLLLESGDPARAQLLNQRARRAKAASP